MATLVTDSLFLGKESRYWYKDKNFLFEVVSDTEYFELEEEKRFESVAMGE